MLSHFVFSFFSCQGQNSEAIKTIDAKAFAEKLQQHQNNILDVRTPDEFSSDHIENAKNINWLGSFISM
jgi:3-mercaptopyruvate sulfurtransferase SseA